MINFDNIKAHSDPDFVAATYSEYLQHRANDYVEMLNIISEAASQEINDGLDNVLQSFETDMATLNGMIVTTCEAAGKDLSQMESSSSEYIAAVEAAINGNSDIQDFINNNFNDSDFIKEHYCEYAIPAYEYNVNVSLPNNSALTQTTREDILVHYKNFSTYCDEAAENICSTYGLRPAMPVTLNAGYTTIKSLVKSVVANGFSSTNDGASLCLDLSNTEGVITANATSLANYSLSSLVDEVKSTLASTVVYAGGFLASTKTTISDRLQVFESYVSGKFKDVTNYASTITTAVKDKLSDSKSTCVDFFNSFLKMTGWKEEDNDIVVPETVDASDMSQYTGASLTGALDWSNAKKVVTNVAKTVATVAASVAIGAFNLVKGLFSRIGKWFVRNVIEGSDLTDLNNGSTSGLIDGFQFQNNCTGNETSSSDVSLTLFFAPNQTATERLAQVTQIRRKMGDWICFSLLYGTLLFKINSVNWDGSSIEFTVCYDYIFKPISVDRNVIMQAAKMAASDTQDSSLLLMGSQFYLTPLAASDVVFQVFGEKIQQLGDFKVSEKALDRARVQGYALGAEMAMLTGENIIQSILRQISNMPMAVREKFPTTTLFSRYMYSSNLQEENERGDTNLDFIKAAAGYSVSNETPSWNTLYREYIGRQYSGSYSNSTFDPSGFVYALITCWLDQYYYPLEYGYLAYSDQEIVLPDPQYRVNTDEQNIAAVNNAITTVIVVAAVAIISLTTIIAFKKLANKRFMKMKAKVGQLDNRMWQGDKLSYREQKKYIRYQRKLAKCNMITKGLTGNDDGLDLLSKVEAVASKVDTVYTQVTGDVSPISSYLPGKDVTSENTYSEESNKVIENVKIDTNKIYHSIVPAM